MPTPNKGETEQEFVSRCIPIVLRDGTAKDQKQAAAICYSMFRNEAMHPDFQRIIGLFFKRYPVKEALEKFTKFITSNGLNPSKAYNPEVQFKESFEWIEPLIQPYKQDTEAKYYLVTALTADISMNNVDYGPEDRLAREDSSMNWRPVNINHDHNRWLPYPRTRVDFSAENEFSLEATLRVDNQDSWLQKKLDSGEIMHPSIEGRPHPISGRYHFTGLALLEKGVELPGMPTAEIVPLVFNESIGKSICEFKGGKMVCECETKTTEVKTNLKEVKEAFGDASFPDSCFAYVPASAKGANGNKSDRKLPYKNADGSISMDHVRNALARLDQTEGIPAAEKERIRNMLQNILKRASPEYEPEEMKEQEVPPATNAPSTVGKDDTATCGPNQHWDSDANKCVDDVQQECDEGWHFDPALQKCIPDNPQVNENALRTAKAELKRIEAEEKLQEEIEKNKSLNVELDKKKAELKIERENHIATKCTLEGRISELEKTAKAEKERADKANEGQLKEAQGRVSVLKDNDALREDNTQKTATIEKQKTQIDNLTRQHTETFAENTRLHSELTDALNREIQWKKDKQDLQEGLAKALKHQKYVYEFLKSKGFEIVKPT